MGLYAAHGVEYHLILSNKRRVVLLSQRDTDDRLVQSEYFKQRREGWFDDVYRRCWCTRIEGDVLTLTPEEREKLQLEIGKYGDRIESHGFFDVNTMTGSM